MHFVHILVGSADPRSINGVNKVVHSLATTQAATGHEAEVWSLTSSSKPPNHDHIYRHRLFRLTKTRFFLDRNLIATLNNLPKDTWVQLHSAFIPELTAIAHRLKKLGVLYGFTAHGGYLSMYFDSSWSLRLKKALFAAFWENWMLRNAAMLHVIGKTELADLRERAPTTETYLIPNGFAFDESVLGLGPRTEMEPASVMFCGRHENKQKGLDLLLRGFARYRHGGGSLRLVMISDGRDSAMLRSLANELQVADEITWTGILSIDELRRTLRGAAAFVHTSRFDVLPTGCLEAAALAVPMFMSRETNFKDYVEPRHAGWMYEPNTPAVIAETLFKIENTSREERLAIGKNARRMITEELRWDFIGERFEAAVLDSRKRLGKNSKPHPPT